MFICPGTGGPFGKQKRKQARGKRVPSAQREGTMPGLHILGFYDQSDFPGCKRREIQRIPGGRELLFVAAPPAPLGRGVAPRQRRFYIPGKGNFPKQWKNYAAACRYRNPSILPRSWECLPQNWEETGQAVKMQSKRTATRTRTHFFKTFIYILPFFSRFRESCCYLIYACGQRIQPDRRVIPNPEENEKWAAAWRRCRHILPPKPAVFSGFGGYSSPRPPPNGHLTPP